MVTVFVICLVIWLLVWLYSYWFGFIDTGLVIWLRLGYMVTGSVICLQFRLYWLLDRLYGYWFR